MQMPPVADDGPLKWDKKFPLLLAGRLAAAASYRQASYRGISLTAFQMQHWLPHA